MLVTLLSTSKRILTGKPIPAVWGASRTNSGGALTQSFCRLENSRCTEYVLPPTLTKVSWPLQMSPISPRSGVGGGLGSYHARGGPFTVADPTCASVTASDSSWLVTAVTFWNNVPRPQPREQALGGAKSGRTPYGMRNDGE